MFIFIGALVLLSILVIFCALAIGKRTEQKIHTDLGDELQQAPVSVRFPEDVFHARTSTAAEHKKPMRVK